MTSTESAFAEAIDAAGISLEDLARLVEAGEYSFAFIDGVFPETGWPLLNTTFGELAAASDLSWDVVQEMYTNWGLPAPVPDQRPREDDERALLGRAAVRDFVGVDVVEQAKAAALAETIGDISLRGVSEPVPLVRAVARDSSPGG